MSLPPTVISVKRKLGDEPVDLLYVQTEGSQGSTTNGKRRITDSLYRFVRLHDDRQNREKLSPRAPSSRPSSTPRLPNETTKEITPVLQEPKLVGERTNFQRSTSPTKGHGSVKRSESPRPARGLRRFLLTKERFSEATTGRTSPNGIQKKKSAPRGGMAVFSEQKKSMLRSMASISDLAQSKHEPDDTPALAESQTLKRPGATATERQWRAENWQARPRDRSVSPLPGTKSSHKPTKSTLSRNEVESLKLAASLQQFALEATAPPKKATPPPEVPVRVDNGGMLDKDDDESEWVYDRYIRHMDEDKDVAISADNLESDMNGLIRQDDLSNGRGGVGLLVIRDEDKEDWEAFGEEDQDSDDETYSEDEDSNAEDFYANDYPEAELSSDDEFDAPGAPYRTKAVSSDDDEYDLANDAWSDEDSYGFSSDEERKHRSNPMPWRSGSSRLERMTNAGDDDV